MGMTPKLQEHTFSDGGSYTFSNDKVCITMVAATSDPGAVARCYHNVVNTPSFFHAEQVPSSQLVRIMACEGGEHPLPAGAATLQRFQVQDEEDNCVICLQKFKSDDDAARLPCSHGVHVYSADTFSYLVNLSV
ncbi:zinc finger protein [Spatholobus suberectus]|nr:zinc finger protein [Spatholobus suberectus]